MEHDIARSTATSTPKGLGATEGAIPSAVTAETAAGTIVLRAAEPADERRLVSLGVAADMGELSGFETTIVAVRADADADERHAAGIVGFCRLRIHDGVAHVNPIVVDEAARGRFVGEALMREARKRYGELRFVARGPVVGFYEHLGCERVPWEAIAPEVAGDCDGCTEYEACRPVPMRMP